MSRIVIDSFAAEFLRYRRYIEDATAQLPFNLLRTPLDPQTNSIAVIMKHISGNLRSRWTDPLTTDGEKPWRNRDQEFIDDLPDSAALASLWSAAWTTLDTALTSFSDADLPRTLTIRGQPHTLALALARALSHTSYHAGQIVQLARTLASRSNLPWRTLTIPRAGTAAFNLSLGYTPPR